MTSNTHIGYHVSILKKAFFQTIKGEYERRDPRSSAYQVFIKTPQRKALSNITDKEFKQCNKYITDNDIYLVAHSTYLINMANPIEGDTYQIDTAVDDLLTIEKLGGRGSVFHVGKHKDRDYTECLRVAKAYIEAVIDETPGSRSLFILETAAGCGTEMMTTIEELGAFYHMFSAKYKKRIKLCIDTCHVYSAGYDLGTKKSVSDFIDLVQKHIKWTNVEVIHLNDSKTALGSKVDRHESLGKGQIPLEGLKYFIKFSKEKKLPIVLETPVGEYRECDMDILSGV